MQPPARLGRTLAATAALSLAAWSAHAAAIERAIPSTVRVLFEEGRYGEVAATYSDPDQSGDNADLTVLGFPGLEVFGNTGDVFEGHWYFAGAYKSDLSDRLSYALLLDQPYGADTDYGEGLMTSAADVPFSYEGTTADLNTYQLTGVVAYDVTPNVKVYGGLRAQRLDADATIPFISDYSVDTNKDWGFGYLLGGAYHRQKIGLRVALTYMSKIEHSLDTDEFSLESGPADTDTDVDTPQSVTLEAQTGIAEDTRVFGSVRWVDWSEFAIAPPVYISLTGGRPLVDYQKDWWTYTAGIGRQFTDTLGGSVFLTYEPSVDEVLTTLGPYDGRTTVTAGLSYDIGKANVAGALTYGKLGDTTNILETDYNDGSVWAATVRFGYSF